MKWHLDRWWENGLVMVKSESIPNCQGKSHAVGPSESCLLLPITVLFMIDALAQDRT